jgi:nucleotide-binding universal stress UspA family protein
MTLSEEATERLADIVDLQPTKNAELQAEWGLDSGSEVYQYLESELGSYYYRNNDNLICATPKARQLVGDGDVEVGDRTVRGTRLERDTLDAVPGPGAEPQSVVATLQTLREHGRDPGVDEVRSTLHTLVEKGLVERVRKTVPTFRLELDREHITVELSNGETE